jgi:O-antigen/teichoic acid export membrane protein
LELGLATLALVWAAPFFDGSVLRSSVTDVREALRFGAVFLAASLLLATVWRAGEVVITVLSASRAEISFYSIASAIAMAVAGLLGQVTALLIPTVTVLHLRGESRRFEDWMATSLRYMTIMSCVVIIGVFTASDWVFPMILGPGFERVSLNLKILSIGLVPLGLVRTAYSVAVVHKAARQVVLVGIEGVAAFLLLTAILVPGLESLGASIAVTTAFFVSGARSIQRMELATIVARSRLGRSLAPAVALALLWVPLLPRLMAGGLALATYLGVATALGVIRADELRLGQRRLFGRSTEQPNSVREEVVDAPI